MSETMQANGSYVAAKRWQKVARRPARIIIVNGFGDTNLGGAAITYAAAQLAEAIDPQGEIAIVPVGPGDSFPYSTSLMPELEVLPPAILYDRRDRISTVARAFHRLARPTPGSEDNDVVRRLAAADFVIAKGGYVFRERVSPRGVLSGLLTMWPLAYGARAGAATVAYSASIGPFASTVSRLLSRSVLRQLDIVCPRDPDSEDRAQHDMAVSSHRLIPMPDCVFGFAGNTRLLGPQPIFDPQHPKLVAIPRQLEPASWAAFVRSVRSARVRLANARMRVVIQASEDVESATRLVRELELPRGSLVECSDPREAIAEYGDANAVLSCRMHGSIFSLLAGTPTVYFDYAAGKCRPVLQTLGLERFFQRLDADPRDIALSIDEALQRTTRDEVTAAVSDAGRRVRDIQATVAARLVDIRLRKAPHERPRGT